MKQLEQQVREKIYQHFVDNTRAYLTTNPATVQECLGALAQGAGAELASLNDQGRVNELEGKIISTVLQGVSTLAPSVQGFFEKRNYGWKQDSTSYGKVDPILDHLKDRVPALQPIAIGLNALKKVALAQSYRRDNVVRSLASRANRDGIESATSPENIYAAIRQEYSDADDYSNAQQAFASTVMQFIPTEIPYAQNAAEVVRAGAKSFLEAIDNTVVKNELNCIYFTE